MKRGILPVILLIGGLLLLCSPVSAGKRPVHGKTDKSGYGEKRPVSSIQEAREALAEHFAGKGLTVGEITEKEFFFEAEILGKDRKPVDRVIIDKRTGRIRSIY